MGRKSSTVAQLHKAYTDEWHARNKRGKTHFIAKGPTAKRVFRLTVQDLANSFK